MKKLKKSPQALNKAVSILKKGGVVICSTDTVYGFLANAASKKAVEKVFKMKKRPKSKPLALFVKDLKMAKEIAEISEEQEKILRTRWPGAYTFILRKAKPYAEGLALRRIALYGTAKNTVALRVPKYKFLSDLLKKINIPLAQTSANLSGEQTLTKIKDIVKQFGKSGILIIDGGDIKKGKPSKILDLTDNKVKVLRK